LFLKSLHFDLDFAILGGTSWHKRPFFSGGTTRLGKEETPMQSHSDLEKAREAIKILLARKRKAAEKK
jgi:hypothetical protein